MTGRSQYAHRVSRRNFLRASAGLALGLGLAPLERLAGYSGRVLARDDPPWDALGAKLSGQLVRPDDMDYLSYASPWNLRYASILPGGVARCLDARDVQTSLQWANEHGVPLVIRSGGHSYAGFSTTLGLMIDVSPMNQVAFDSRTGRATLGGGARNGDVYANLRPAGVAVTHGRCKAVGVAGLVLGGGIGFNMRAHGLTCDQLVETELVLADGSLLRCSETQNDDLFWACRGGGGGNFGVNTSFTFQTFPVAELTVYDITWTENTDDVLAALQDIVLSSPNSLGCKVSVNAQRSGSQTMVGVNLLGQLRGTPAELHDLLAPAYAVASGRPSIADIRQLEYWDAQEFLSEEGDPAYSHERSRYVADRIPDEGLARIMQYMRSWPGTSAGASWKFFLLGGEVRSLAPSATAYVHRPAAMISSIALEWDATEEGTDALARNQAWLDEFHAAMGPYTSDRCYQNFIDPSQTDWQRAYYGSNLGRLIEAKTRYDPENVFSFPQSIPVAEAGSARRWQTVTADQGFNVLAEKTLVSV